MSIEIEGVLTEIIFKNEDNAYTVALIENQLEQITVVGYMPVINDGGTYAFNGKWIKHPTYGEQFEVISYKEITPNTIEGIEKYLSSGIIKGVGPKMAKRIVNKFGKDTLDIMQSNPARLMEISGIGKSKYEKIMESFKEQRNLRELMMFLQQYGVTPAYAIKIYKKYEDEAIKLIQENPYRLADEIVGIGFKIADSIAKKMGIDPTSPYRIRCGIKYILNNCSLEGHTYVKKDNLIKDGSSILTVPKGLIEDTLVKLTIDHEIHMENIDGEICVFEMSLFYSESYVCRKIIDMASVKVNHISDNIEEEIKKIEEIENINLASKQKLAIKSASENGILIITGGPGTGKTTTINNIIKILEDNNLSIALAAPTGRAAKRMSETTGREAKTIHRLLEYSYMEGDNRLGFNKDEDEPLTEDVVIIDEMSMVDIRLMHGLMKSLPLGTRLILVGDVDQLPSVGPGNVLRDIIESKLIKVVELNEIFRQAKESMIVVNAHKINRGEYPKLNKKEKDFFFMSRKNQEDMVKIIKDLSKERLPNFKKCDPIKDIQVLTPMKKGTVGMYNLNNTLQSVLNPEAPYKIEKEMKDKILRVGDKIMQMKNNYNLKWKNMNSQEEGVGVFNGDFGYIDFIDKEEKEVHIIFDEEKVVKYDFSQLDEIELAYAITIHKSQGSEFPIVIMPISFGPPMLLTRNLLYTAVTRAKELVVMVGVESGLKNMVDNHRIRKRNSGLLNKLRKFVDAGVIND
ncbi:MAG: ATP-dependent RecD-like DNA helicase [Anaeromicrobium sp.]|jgi:exodeoxyribonuclease V alpha subunit|uniref:SF1B family DNA helicase RecD2 n=1 Tax=Anaeromicrobium sp. TaxID=1929132 RepID=UPI0025DFF959|nr:ATP-dependent RecD-like DNA helicase [Anaeromicrobium sp.]MCT4595408.1 ATP-dependent RecD-like DNA helicase [Anaeromicrobium sp.]